jgi:hypothetical protein
MADLGDLMPLAIEIRDTSGNLANGGSVALTVTLPDGTTATPTVTNPSVGRYEAIYTPPQPGRYVARWLSTGLNASAYVETFDVRPGDPGYIVSLSDAKRALNLDLTDTSNDEELRSLIGAVTTAVENYRGEVIVRRSFTEYVSGRRAVSRRRLTLSRTPVLSLTSVTRPYDAFTWSATDVVLVDPEVGIIVSYGTPFYGELVITYTAGYQVVPDNYIEGAKIILRHLWEVQQTPGMSSGTSPFGDSGAGTSANPAYAIPNRAAEMLGGRGPQVA